jgi:hypothetical protein
MAAPTADDAIEAVVAAVYAAAVFAKQVIDGDVNPADETAIAIQTKSEAAKAILQSAPALLAELRESREQRPASRAKSGG